MQNKSKTRLIVLGVGIMMPLHGVELTVQSPVPAAQEDQPSTSSVSHTVKRFIAKVRTFVGNEDNVALISSVGSVVAIGGAAGVLFYVIQRKSASLPQEPPQLFEGAQREEVEAEQELAADDEVSHKEEDQKEEAPLQLRLQEKILTLYKERENRKFIAPTNLEPIALDFDALYATMAEVVRTPILNKQFQSLRMENREVDHSFLDEKMPFKYSKGTASASVKPSSPQEKQEAIACLVEAEKGGATAAHIEEKIELLCRGITEPGEMWALMLETVAPNDPMNFRTIKEVIEHLEERYHLDPQVMAFFDGIRNK